MENIFTQTAVLKNFKKPLKIKKLKISEIKSDQVLVRLFYSGVCKSQLMEIDGGRSNKKYLPHMLGHEGSGIVEKVGKKIKKVKKGDEVILTWIKTSGTNSGGGFIKNKNKKINYGPVTTFSNYSIVSENRLVKKPKYIDRKIATLFGCALSTGAGMVLKQSKISQNNNVLVYGLGGIGFCSLVTLLAIKQKNIYVYDLNKDKVRLAEKFGAKKIDLNLKQKKYLNFFDVCIETCGQTNTIEKGLDLIKNKGTLIFASHPSKNKKIKIKPHDLIKGKKIIGSWGGSTNLEKDLSKYFKILKNKINLLKFLVNKIYKIEDINIALNHMRKGLVIRPIIKF